MNSHNALNLQNLNYSEDDLQNQQSLDPYLNWYHLPFAEKTPRLIICKRMSNSSISIVHYIAKTLAKRSVNRKKKKLKSF